MKATEFVNQVVELRKKHLELYEQSEDAFGYISMETQGIMLTGQGFNRLRKELGIRLEHCHTKAHNEDNLHVSFTYDETLFFALLDA